MTATPEELWIGRDNAQLGPYTLDTIRQWQAEGSLRTNDLLWWDGLPRWTERDAALTELGIIRQQPAQPPRAVPPPLSTTSPNRGRRTVLFVLLGALCVLAIVLAAVFSLMRPAFLSQSSGTAHQDMRNVLSAASMIKVAYAEYVVSTAKVPQSLQDIGMNDAPYGAMTRLGIESGTILVGTTHGVLAIQPYRNIDFVIDFRCGHAPAPPGMMALGEIDAAMATTVPEELLPDGCR